MTETPSRSKALDYNGTRKYRTVPWIHVHFRHVSSFSSCNSVALLQKWEFEEVRYKQQHYTSRKIGFGKVTESISLKQRYLMLCRSCTKLPVVWLSSIAVGWSMGISNQYVRSRPLIGTSYRGLKSLQGNILINDGGQAVLTDFGLSIALEMSGFTTKNTPGTLRYMAPELLAEPTTSAAIRPTTATDAWAFGITATEVRSPSGTYSPTISDMFHL